MSTAGKLDINFHADEKDLIKAQARVIKQLDEAISKYKAMGKEGKKAAKDAGQELERFAAKTRLINKTPAEKYREELEKLNRALKAGLINQETYNRAVKRAGIEQRHSFGSSALSSLTSYLTGLISITAAVGGVTTAVRQYRQELDALGENQVQNAPGLGELAQLADTPQELRRMIDEAKATFAEGGAATLGQAGELQFALESAGVAEYRKDVAALQSANVVRDATNLVDAAAALQTSLGTTETGSFRDIVSKGFGASTVSPSKVDEILVAAAKSGSQAKALGLSDEEVLAAIGAVSKIEKGADTAGTQIESLLKQIEVYGVTRGYLESGKSLRDQVLDIQKLVEGGTDVREILGDRQEGVKAFRNLIGEEGTKLYAQAMQKIAEYERDDAFGTKVGLANIAAPELAAVKTKRIAQARLELAGSEDATTENLADAVAADLVADMREKRGTFMGVLQRGQNWFDRTFFGNEAFIKDYGDQSSAETQRTIQQLGDVMSSVGDKMDRAATRLEGAAEGSGTNAARARQATAGGAVEAR